MPRASKNLTPEHLNRTEALFNGCHTIKAIAELEISRVLQWVEYARESKILIHVFLLNEQGDLENDQTGIQIG